MNALFHSEVLIYLRHFKRAMFCFIRTSRLSFHDEEKLIAEKNNKHLIITVDIWFYFKIWVKKLPGTCSISGRLKSEISSTFYFESVIYNQTGFINLNIDCMLFTL